MKNNNDMINRVNIISTDCRSLFQELNKYLDQNKDLDSVDRKEVINLLMKCKVTEEQFNYNNELLKHEALQINVLHI